MELRWPSLRKVFLYPKGSTYLIFSRIDLLKEIECLNSKTVSTPIDANHKMDGHGESGIVDKWRYQRLVGRIIYLSHTRLDIAYVVVIASKFMHDSKEEHMRGVYWILHYLKATPGKCILFKKGDKLNLEVYIDANYAGSPIDRRSTSGYSTSLGGNLVTWRSKK